MALRRLEHTQVSGAPVVDRGRVVGVVTLRDLLAPALPDGEVREVMTAEPVTARADWPLAQVVVAMERAGVNRVPVVDVHGRPVGILTRDDVLRVLARRIRELRSPRRGSEMEPD
jgi:CBS domain-containing protein